MSDTQPRNHETRDHGGAPEGNQNAYKGESALRSQLNIRCHPREKSAWVKCAHPAKLADWVRETLNKASGHDPES